MRDVFKEVHWRLRDLPPPQENALKVFSCFSCGGGSTMGYKLAGCEVLGNVEIDPRMMEVYRKNHKPKYSFLMGVQEFKKLPKADIPPELFNLDILDGSPPCSLFSTNSIKRESFWGKEKKFAEGQSAQILDTLFFDFIDIAEILKPKVVIAENVAGLLKGNARGYVRQIFDAFKKAGYSVQLFKLDASVMGVPQRRNRVFFIAFRNDLGFPKLTLSFNYPQIPFKYCRNDEEKRTDLSPLQRKVAGFWRKGESNLAKAHLRAFGKVGWFSYNTHHDNQLAGCQTVGTIVPVLFPEKKFINDSEVKAVQTFPKDFDFCGKSVQYVCGMSVPPRMMEKIVLEIKRQWFSLS